MQPVHINYLAVVVAAVASMILGSFMVGPLFGKIWMQLSGITPQQKEAAKAREMAKIFIIAFVGSCVMSNVLAHSLVFASAYYKMDGVPAGVMAGFWNWLGFVAPVILGSVLWEGKPWKLWVLHNGYYLLSQLVMGMILAL